MDGRCPVGDAGVNTAPLLPKRQRSRAPLWPPILQGLFFDDSYGFYPGQVLIGPAKIFSSVQWLSGVKPVLSTKSKFRVVVEEVRRRRGGE